MILAFVMGMFVGACIAVPLFACVCMSGRQDDLQERHQ